MTGDNSSSGSGSCNSLLHPSSPVAAPGKVKNKNGIVASATAVAASTPTAATSATDSVPTPSSATAVAAVTTITSATKRGRGRPRLDYSALNKQGSPVVKADNESAASAAADACDGADESDGLFSNNTLSNTASYEIRKVVVENAVSFKCPQHFCRNCFDFYGPRDGGDLNKCIACPRAYHTNCIPPGSRFNSVCVLCPLHPDAPLPSHEPRAVRSTAMINSNISDNGKSTKNNSSSSSSQMQEKEIGCEFTAFWEQLAIPDVCPDASQPFDNHFKLQRHIKEDAANAPQTFKIIQRNDWEYLNPNAGNKPLPSNFVPDVACECKVDCDENCLNRVLRIECCDSKVRGSGGGAEGDRAICAIGGKCSNRQLQSRKYAKHEVFREFQMGWGLRCTDYTAAGALILEYVGEVIDYEEVHRRMTSQRELTPLDRDFYIMELDNGVYVDGKFKGSNSRFINHSCDPNCELQRWIVKGSPRIGIFAIRDIAKGEALSYDYQFDTKEEEAFKCYCGTDKCRGTMAPKKKKTLLYDASGRPQSKEERDRLILLGKLKQQSMTYEGLVQAEWGRSYTGKCVPGDPINEIKNGPVKATLSAGSYARLFLLRNVRAGSNFFQRKERLEARARRAAGKLVGGGSLGGGGAGVASGSKSKSVVSMASSASVSVSASGSSPRSAVSPSRCGSNGNKRKGGSLSYSSSNSSSEEQVGMCLED